MLTALLTLFVLGIVGLVAVTVVLTLFGLFFGLVFGAVGLAFTLLVKVAPVLLIGYVVVRLIQRGGVGCCGRRRLSAADQRWLDS